MDALVLILMIIMYLVWQAMTSVGSKEKPRPSSEQPQGPSRPRQAAEGGELDEALREIREALGGPAPPTRTPREMPGQRPPPSRSQREPADARRARREELEHQRREVEQETRRYEEQTRSAMQEQIERQRKLSERAAAAERRAEGRDAAIDTPLQVERRADRDRRAPTGNLTERFFDPESLQEAVVMNEILAPPRARRRRRR